MSGSPKRLLTIGHSYVVGANRRLAHEIAVAGRGQWEVTAVAPTRYHADLGRVSAGALAGEANRLVTLDVRLDRSPHLMWYSGLRQVLDAPWDVVHCWEEPYVAAGAQVARLARRDSRVVPATFQNIAKRYPWPLTAFERSAMARADGWIAFGETVRQALEGRPGYAGKPSRTIPPGVDIERFRPDPDGQRRFRTRLGWHADDSVVGFLGRFVPQKGLALLCDALRGASANWRALFVGGGPMQAELESFAREYQGRVHIANGVGHDEVPAWLNAMSMLCAPSETTTAWREQFGRMLIEAMACGVAVIASDSGEMPFVVGDAGAIVPEGDVSAWSAAIDRLSEPVARQSLAARGLDRARSRFAWPVVAREHLAFFGTLLERPVVRS